ncbi:response regulator [Halomonas vilamensis]|uniref:Response regulator n=1 Tax=Vreelandella vilamensis TaxID=531309 RepID=A0ABU1H037_9GAMM|nr:HD domain-containing phosphohydrolase [Halomonas vilamensis]MDR5897661.1 response regulator [Halomonas vilamensis]
MSQSASVLIVDDEPNILRALRRLLRSETFRVLTTSSGEEALEILADEPVNVVVSDSKMPGMDGAELLSRVQASYPDCIRILLTGHHDLEAVTRAINEGHIYHYIAKPWHDDDLCFILRQAIAFNQSERERKRLEALTQAQNDELKRFNSELEARVDARTAELSEIANQLDSAHETLKHSYVTTTRVFSSLINMRLPERHQTNSQITQVIKGFLQVHPVEEGLRYDLLMAASLYNLGKLSWDDHLLGLSSEKMFGDDRERYQKYPETAGELLMALEPLHGAAKLIRHHQERWNGSGFPNHLKAEAIPWGARLLRLSVDFIELQRGLMLNRNVSRDNALMLLEKLAGRVYDPMLSRELVTFLHDHAPDMGIIDASVMALSTDKLEPGMILLRDLHSKAGHLLLNEGRELTAGLIDKLISFESTESIRYTLLVRLPDEEALIEDETET